MRVDLGRRRAVDGEFLEIERGGVRERRHVSDGRSIGVEWLLLRARGTER